MAKRPPFPEPCAPCLAKRQELINAAAEGRIFDAAKAAAIGAAMMAGLIPKKIATAEDFAKMKEKINDHQSASRP